MKPNLTSHIFSRRFRWDLQSNPLNDLLQNKKRNGETIIDLTESNPTAVGMQYPEREVLMALNQAAVMRYEPHPRGLMIARHAVADYYRQRGDIISVDQIHLTTSTSEAYGYLFKLLTDPGDNVLAPQPSYPLFEFLAGLENLELQNYRLEYNETSGWKIDLESVARAINDRTRAIIVVQPNNPTGSSLKLDELTALVSLCREYRLALVFDEVFFDYRLSSFKGQDSEAVSGIAVSEVLSFTMSGISKILGLPQMKLGWIVVNGPGSVMEQAQERLDLIADTYLSVSTPIQHAAPIWLKMRPLLQQQIQDRVSENLDWLRTALKTQSNPKLLRLDGGWYATLAIPDLNSEEGLVLELLETQNVLIHPGFFFDFPNEGILVLSLLSEPAIFNEGVTRVLTFIRG
jgi:hypothetical protein